MNKKTLSSLMEWIRPVGIGTILFCSYAFDSNPAERFHLLGPLVALIMSGTVAFEALFLGEAGSEKIGYTPNRAYQIQSGLANAAIALTALLVFLLKWGSFADATVTVTMLLFFALSGANHLATALLLKNFKPVNLLRPALALFLIAFLLPPLIQALKP